MSHFNNSCNCTHFLMVLHISTYSVGAIHGYGGTEVCVRVRVCVYE